MDFNPPLEKNVRLKVSLSNGETFYEGTKPFEFIAGEKSALQRMLDYIDDHALEIRSVSLLTRKGVEHHLPSAGNSPRFKEFESAEKPYDYRVYRKFGADVMGGKTVTDHFTVAEAFYPGKLSVQLWVNESPPHSSYIVVKKGD